MSNAFAPRGTQLQRGAGSPAVYTTIAEVLKIQRTGSKSDMADVTNMDSPNASREYLPTLLEGGEINFECNLIAPDATQANMLADFNAQTLSPWKVQLPNSLGHWNFNAFVIADDFDLPIDKQGTKSVKLKITGLVTFVAGS